MITRQDIDNLAVLARVHIDDSEKEKMTKEIESILSYVGQVQNLNAGDMKTKYVLKNVMRDDVALNPGGEFSEKLLALAPQKEGKYFKVKKILE